MGGVGWVERCVCMGGWVGGGGDWGLVGDAA